MANEGIMALPQMGPMQGQGPENRPTVTSADSYDAAQTALGMVDPQALEQIKAQVRASIGDLQLTTEQINALIQVLEYVSQNPSEYRNLVQTLEESGAVEKGTLPAEYDPEFIGVMLVVLQEMRNMQAQGAAQTMDLGPIVEGLQPQGMAKGGLADVASYLAAQGRGGDTMLAHINPEEAKMLRAMGGSGTINPITGLPEFKGGVLGGISDAISGVGEAISGAVNGVVNVAKDVLKSPVGRVLGTIALATVLGPAGVGLTMGTAAGLAGAGTSLLAGGSLKDALISGAMGYIGGGGTIMGVSPVSSIGQYLPGAVGGALNTGLATGVLGTGIGLLGGMRTEDALRMGLTSGATAAALSGLKDTSLGRSAEEQATRDEVFRRAAAGDQTAADMVRSGDYTGAIKAPGQIGATGQIGTAQDVLGGGIKAPGMAPSMSYDPMSGTFKPDYGITPGGAPYAGGPGMEGTGAGLRLGGAQATGVPGMEDAIGTGLRPNVAFGPADYSIGAGGRGVATNYSLTPSPVTPASASAPSGIIDRAISGAKNLYNEYLSPSRPGLPADAGMFTKYGPLALAGTAGIAALGGMQKTPAADEPLYSPRYTGSDYIRDNPNKFQGGLDFSYVRPTSINYPVVPESRFSTVPISQAPTMLPMGATMSRAGIAQPYNVGGLYGVPLIYNQLPVGRAKGGVMSMTEFPRRNGPINGPGTGTSDSIPAMLSDGEFVFTAKAVRNAGNGSRRKGAKRMYALMKKLEGGPVRG